MFHWVKLCHQNVSGQLINVFLYVFVRVVHLLQPYPVDDAVRLLSPILSAETWVRNKLQFSRWLTNC